MVSELLSKIETIFAFVRKQNVSFIHIFENIKFSAGHNKQRRVASIRTSGNLSCRKIFRSRDSSSNISNR